MVSAEQLKQWLKRPEGVNLEFKEAKAQFGHDKDLPDYCAALANEGGGKLILGADNKGCVVGTKAFTGTHNQLSHDLLQKIGIRVDVEELHYEGQRVLIFHVPPRPWIGRPVKSTGNYTYPMRAGESLVEMDEQTLKRILNEGEPDFSEQIVPGLTIADLNSDAIENFKQRWAQKSKRNEYQHFSIDKLLKSIGCLSDKGLNYASLILFGNKEKVDELMPGSEIIFEWRHDQAKTAHDFRINWREPFFAIYDDIWNTINARNIRFPFQEGLFQREVYAFNEKAIREALLNAVAHRDYRISGRSIFIKASPQEFFIESPGGFPQGITPDNILEKSYWRNRRIAEILEKAEMVERAGQGMNDIFESSIREGKGVPNFQGSDAYSVVLRIPAQVKDKNFILFLEKTAKEKQIILSFEEIFELEKIRESGLVSNKEFRDKFIRLGFIEQVGRTRGTKYILSHHYYLHTDKTGVHTRLKGLSREQKKELVLNHLKTNKKGVMKDLKDAFTDMNRGGINNLLQELKKAGKIEHIGSKSQGYWILKDSKN
jgi:ATP-dependent DNA helicase RecG